MCILTMLINGIFAFILVAGMWFTSGGVTTDLILSILFYIIITPVLTVTMTKIMFQSENTMLVTDALKRIDSILNLEPLESTDVKTPKDNSVVLKSVSYSYDKGNKTKKQLTIYRFQLSQMKQLHLSDSLAAVKPRLQTS